MSHEMEWIDDKREEVNMQIIKINALALEELHLNESGEDVVMEEFTFA